MPGLRLAIDPTGMTSGGRKAEDALDDVKRKAGETEKATDRVGGQFRKTGNEAKNAAPKVDTVGRSLSNFTGMAVKAGAALAALGVGLSAGMAFRRFVSATVEADAAQAQLSAAITSTGGAAGRSIADLNRHAAELQRLTSFGDDTTNAMQGLLLTFTNIQGGTFDRATVAVQDLATAMGKDLSSSALQVGKALNDPVLGMSALAESGIQFSKAQKEAVKAMVETNDIAGAQAIILAELERQFGGSAEAARNTLGGALNALGNAWGDVFEIGSDASEGLRQSVEALVDTVSDPAFVSSIQAIGSAMFSAAEIAARSLSFVVENADILGTSLALLAARSLPGAAAGLYAMATGAGVATGAVSALAVAMNLVPWVAAVTAATLAYRAYNETRSAAETYGVAQEELNATLKRYSDTGAPEAREAAIDLAKSQLSAAEATLAAAAAQNELASANRYGLGPGALASEIEKSNRRLRDAEAEVQNLRSTLADLEGSIGDAGDATNGLADAIGGINFSGAIQGAAFLANDLGVNLEIATKLNAALNRSAGIQSGPKPQKFSLGLPSVQTGDVGNAALRYGNLNTPPATRFEVPDLSGGGVSGLSGGGGGGGGSAQVDRTKEAYDALMASLDPAVAASQRLAKAQETINAAMASGHVTTEDAADAYSLAQEAFDKATESIGAGTNVWKTFQEAGANAIDRLIDGTGNLKDALIDMLKQMALAIANKRILENGGTEVSSLGGLIFNAFAGLFDGGGTIRHGQTGIVGERGPELVKSTPMGTVVTSRQDTARMLGGMSGRSGGDTFAPVYNIDARGADAGAVPRIERAIARANAEFESRAINAFNIGKKRRQIV